MHCNYPGFAIIRVAIIRVSLYCFRAGGWANANRSERPRLRRRVWNRSRLNSTVPSVITNACAKWKCESLLPSLCLRAARERERNSHLLHSSLSVVSQPPQFQGPRTEGGFHLMSRVPGRLPNEHQPPVGADRRLLGLDRRVRTSESMNCEFHLSSYSNGHCDLRLYLLVYVVT